VEFQSYGRRMTEGNLGREVEARGEQEKERAIICSVKAWFPSRRMTVALIGSSTFYSSCSPSLCRYLGEALWNYGVSIATAGTIGIPELVAWSYTYFGQPIALQSAFHFVQCKDKRIGDCIERSDIGHVIAAGKTEEVPTTPPLPQSIHPLILGTYVHLF